HRMSVAPEALVEAAHLLMDHRVHGDRIFEFTPLCRGRKIAVIKEVAGFEEIAMLRQLIDRIAAIEQDAFVAVNEGYFGLAGRCRGEAWIIGEYAGVAVEVADIDDIGAERSLLDRKIVALVAECEGG